MIIDANGNRIHFSDADLRIHSEGRVGREVTFKSRTGLEFWFDSDRESVLTSNDNIYLYIYVDLFPGYLQKAFVLHIDGRSIAFADEDGQFFDQAKSHAKKAEDGNFYWAIGSVGAMLKVQDENRRSYYHYLTNSDKFSSRDQQEFSITLVEDMLSNISQDIRRLAFVRPQHASVVWSDSVKKKLENGSLIEG
ncbi:MAG: hypothetical protein Rhims3KO_13970 [Hyphomicrobiales bacterium]